MLNTPGHVLAQNPIENPEGSLWPGRDNFSGTGQHYHRERYRSMGWILRNNECIVIFHGGEHHEVYHQDDSASAASSMEVMDRIASLEQRVQMQEDEIQLLKSALADVVRRLNISEEQNAMINRRGPTKARPMMAALPLRHTVNNGTVLPKKSCGTLLSPTGSRKDAAAPETKSTVRRTNSNETMGTLTRKDSGDSKSNRTRTGSTGSNSSGKRASESKLKEPVFNAVTVQIYLAHPSKRTGTAEAPKSNAAAVSGRCSAPPTAPDSKSASDKSVKSNGVRKTPTFALPLRKSVRQSSYTPYSPLDKPSYRSPIKSPSQYFQICY